MKKVLKTLEQAVVGSILFVGAVCAVAIAFVSIFRH